MKQKDMNSTEAPWLGIDFGTCRSSAAMLIGRELRQVELGYGGATRVFDMPTAVYIDPQGNKLAGEMAVNARFRDPTRFFDRFKLQIQDPRGALAMIDGETRSYPWAELVAPVLSFIRTAAQRSLNNDQPLTRAVLTVPAMYAPGAVQLQVMQQAARLAGFEEVRILSEPHAAALYYDHVLALAGQRTAREGELTLVYDLGGGTFDPVLIQRRNGRLDVLAAHPGGGIRCGGIFFDEKIRQHFQEQCPNSLASLEPPRRDGSGSVLPEDTQRAARYARDLISIDEFLIGIKHRFSYPEFDEVREWAPPLLDVEYRLTRTRFDNMISQLLRNTVRCCEELLNANGKSWGDLARIILVGGSCHLPLVRETLKAAATAAGATGVDICWNRISGTNSVLDPSLAVSLGAALGGAPVTQPATERPTERQVKPGPARDTAENTAAAGKVVHADYPVYEDPFEAFRRKAGDNKESRK